LEETERKGQGLFSLVPVLIHISLTVNRLLFYAKSCARNGHRASVSTLKLIWRERQSSKSVILTWYDHNKNTSWCRWGQVLCVMSSNSPICLTLFTSEICQAGHCDSISEIR
jgi:hypothetical protein